MLLPRSTTLMLNMMVSKLKHGRTVNTSTRESQADTGFKVLKLMPVLILLEKMMFSILLLQVHMVDACS